MKKSIIIFACLFFFCLHAFSQVDSVLRLGLPKTIATDVSNFTYDNLGNLYLVKNNNQVKKINANGDSIAIYNDVKRYGSIFSIDATNPLKVLVFYKDFSTIVVLDRLLNVRNTIDLRRQQIFQVQAIATSYDNNIWIFDEQNSKLKKLDETGKVILESNDFRQVFDNVPRPQVMYDRDGQLFMYDTARGLLVFDYYGALKTSYTLLNVDNVQVLDKKNITASNATQLVLYKPATFQAYTFSAFDNPKKYQKIIFTGSIIYALDQNGKLEIYNLN